MYFSPIQTAAYTITAHAMSQLMAISNASMREKALNYVQEIALKHSGTTKVIMNNISGILANFKAKNANPAKIGWLGYCTITILGVGTVYILFKARFPSKNDPHDPNSLINSQSRILKDIEDKERQQKAAQAALNNGLVTEQGLLKDALEVANKDERLIDGVEGNFEQIAKATALLDQLIAALERIKAKLDSLPTIQAQEDFLRRQEAQIESVKSGCRKVEAKLTALKPACQEEKEKIQLMLTKCKQHFQQSLKKGQDDNSSSK